MDFEIYLFNCLTFSGVLKKLFCYR